MDRLQRAEGIHHHNPRPYRRNLLNNLLKYRFEALREGHVREADEAHGRSDLRHIEETVLLLVTQHFKRRFPKDTKVERRLFDSRVREGDLMR